MVEQQRAYYESLAIYKAAMDLTVALNKAACVEKG